MIGYGDQYLEDPFTKQDYRDMLKSFKQDYDTMPFKDFIKMYDSSNYSMQILNIKSYEKLGGSIDDILKDFHPRKTKEK